MYLKLIVYKKKACVYFIEGTRYPISTFNKEATSREIASELMFNLILSFWDHFGGIFHKGKFYEVTTLTEASELIEKLIKEN